MSVFFKQKAQYEIAEWDWSSDVGSSDLSHPSDKRVLPRQQFHTFSSEGVEDWTEVINICKS